MEIDFLINKKIQDKTFCYIDCETLNLCLSYVHNLPWQVGILNVVNDRIAQSHELWIKWNTHLKISKEAAEITKYSQATMDKYGKDISEVYSIIENSLDSADYIVGHNLLGFDIYLIKDLYNNIGKKDYRHLLSKIIDTNCLLKAIETGREYNKNENFLEFQYKMYHFKKKGLKTNLMAVGQKLGIEHEYHRLHDAIVDLELNKKVWEKIRERFDIF